MGLQPAFPVGAPGDLFDEFLRRLAMFAVRGGSELWLGEDTVTNEGRKPGGRALRRRTIVVIARSRVGGTGAGRKRPPGRQAGGAGRRET